MDAEILRLVFDGGFGLVALYLLHGVAGKLGALEATLSMVARAMIGGGRDDEG